MVHPTSDAVGTTFHWPVPSQVDPQHKNMLLFVQQILLVYYIIQLLRSMLKQLGLELR